MLFLGFGDEFWSQKLISGKAVIFMFRGASNIASPAIPGYNPELCIKNKKDYAVCHDCGESTVWRPTFEDY